MKHTAKLKYEHMGTPHCVPRGARGVQQGLVTEMQAGEATAITEGMASEPCVPRPLSARSGAREAAASVASGKPSCLIISALCSDHMTGSASRLPCSSSGTSARLVAAWRQAEGGPGVRRRAAGGVFLVRCRD